MQNQAVAEQIVKTLKEANNVLVTVKNSPSVDELTAAIGLTLLLNRMDKHAVTVFSGRVPSTLEFLQPDMAIDNTTDSLRDFIIALDKSKADKLRYKVEDNVVRIFITPYKSSITQNDLDFSQGDFNVDAVIALGVVTKEDFDQAVTAHGRILHDAAVITVTKHDAVSQIGSINWQEQQASSVSEMIASIVDQLGPDVLDGQIATALLTGIVAETDRFKNANTTPNVLALSSKLMTAGANQQLIVEKLEAPDMSSTGHPLVESPLDNSNDDGALEINHDDEIQNIHIDDTGELQLPAQQDEPVASIPIEQPVKEEQDTLQPIEEGDSQSSAADKGHLYMQSEEPAQLYGQDDSGKETAQPLFEDNKSNDNEPEVAPEPPVPEVAAHKQRVIEPLSPEETVEPPTRDDSQQTLTDIEKSVDSPHVSPDATANVDDFLGSSRAAPVIEPVVSEIPAPAAPVEEVKPETPTPPVEDVVQVPEPTPQVVNPSSPPSVPPPLMPQAPTQPQFFDADGSNNNPFLNPNS